MTLEQPDIDTLAQLTLTSPDGQSVRLADLWSKRPVVLVFLRHFG